MAYFLISLPISNYSCMQCPFYKEFPNAAAPPQCLLFHEIIAGRTRCEKCRETFVEATNTWIDR